MYKTPAVRRRIVGVMKLMKQHLIPALGVALGVSGCAGGGRVASTDVAEVTRRTAGANAALMRGDMDAYLEHIAIAKDYTLMSPFGGTPTRGFDASPEHRAALSRFFKAGSFEQEVIASHAAGDLIVLVTIERTHVEVGGLPAQAWPLRVTQVFLRDAAQWQLVHRHADPLVNGISLEEAAALARGEQR